MDANTNTVSDIIIVGAGLSGIACALELMRHGCISFRILEASHRIGGRTLADEDGTDLGGTFIGPMQDRIMALVDANAQTLQQMDVSMKSTQYFGGTVQHFSGATSPLSAIASLEVAHVMADLDRLQRTIDPIHPMDSLDAAALDQTTVEEYFLQHTVSEEARNAMRVAVRGVLAAEPSEISLLGWCWHIRQGGGIRRVLETEGGAQDSKVVGGAGNIAVIAAKRLPPHSIVTNSPIRRIDYTCPDAITVTVGSGKAYYCRRLVLAIAPVQQLRIDYDPPLDPNRVMSLQQWPMGHAIKTFTYYKEAFWRKKGLNGSATCDQGISYECFEDVKPDGSKPCIMGFIVSDMAAKVASLSQAERCAMLAQHYFQAEEALAPVA
ncbi:monoamine oxidase, putative [Bodo saltans]|uniref:Amine oxidase n=1 Tax=Bodo saltans TaxID=75058 RepID=A0A0S4IQ09_BODSA|nr:monoamine oxidase, putative [Bodo saltans]|eukprot:CUE78594.1 monoamine oxidase, putative [Bodo saltans]